MLSCWISPSVFRRQNSNPHKRRSCIIQCQKPRYWFNSSLNSAEEADQKLVCHALQSIRSSIGNVLVWTVDIDVILLCLPNRRLEWNTCNIFAWMAAGMDAIYYDINLIPLVLGEERCTLSCPFLTQWRNVTSRHTFLTKENASSGADGMISFQKTRLHQSPGNLMTNSILFHRNKHSYWNSLFCSYILVSNRRISSMFSVL